MAEKLTIILPFITLLTFIVIFHRKNDITSYLLLVLFLLPLMDVKVVPEWMGGYKTFDVISFYCFFFFIRRFIQAGAGRGVDYYFFIFGLLVIVLFIGSLVSEFKYNSLKNLVKIFPIFIFTRLFIAECYDNPNFLNQAIKALKITFSITLLFLLIQVVVGLQFTLSSFLNPNTFDIATNVTRYPGIFYDSQGHGLFLSIGSFIFLYGGKNNKPNLYSYILFFLMIVGILLAGSRSAFGGFAFGILTLIFLGGKSFRIYSFCIITLFILFYGMLSTSSGIFSRAKNLNDDYLFRNSLWQNALKISAEHPFVGIGTGNYQSYVKRYEQDHYLESEGQIYYFDQPENGYLKVLVEFGYPGFIAFLLLIISPVIGAVMHYKRHNADNGTMTLFAGLGCWIIAFSSVYTFFDNRNLILVATLLTMLIVRARKDIIINESH